MKKATNTTEKPTVYKVGQVVEIVANMAHVGRAPAHVRLATVTRCTASNVWVSGVGTSLASREPIVRPRDWQYAVRPASREVIAKHTPVTKAAPAVAPAPEVCGYVMHNECLVAFTRAPGCPVKSFGSELGGRGGISLVPEYALPGKVANYHESDFHVSPCYPMPADLIEAARAALPEDFKVTESEAAALAPVLYIEGEVLFRDTQTGALFDWVTVSPGAFQSNMLCAYVAPFALAQ